MTILIQTIGTILVMMQMFSIYINYKKGFFNKVEYILWEGLFACLFYSTLSPALYETVSAYLEMPSWTGLVIFLFFIFLTKLIYMNYLSNVEIKKQLEALIRMKTLEELPKL